MLFKYLSERKEVNIIHHLVKLLEKQPVHLIDFYLSQLW